MLRIIKNYPPIPEAWQTLKTSSVDADAGKSLVYVEAFHPDGFYRADVKWDGCINLYLRDSFYADEKIDDPERWTGEGITDLHICDLDRLIRRLEALRDLARNQFGPKWPMGCEDL